MNEFAKLFKSQKYGQICVILEEDDYVSYDLGKCNFEKIDLKFAENIAECIFKGLGI